MKLSQPPSSDGADDTYLSKEGLSTWMMLQECSTSCITSDYGRLVTSSQYSPNDTQYSICDVRWYRGAHIPQRVESGSSVIVTSVFWNELHRSVLNVVSGGYFFFRLAVDSPSQILYIKKLEYWGVRDVDDTAFSGGGWK